MKALQILKTAYRATIEEQDDTIVWITHAMKGAGAELDVLLKGNAVNYAVAAQNAEGLSFGDWLQTQPPRLGRDIDTLIGKDVSVYAVDEDVVERGLDGGELVDGVKRIRRDDTASLVRNYDQVWQW